jgi:hypothetical protein
MPMAANIVSLKSSSAAAPQILSPQSKRPRLIEFESHERDCEHNIVALNHPELGRVRIKDYRVRIDGEPRAWIISMRPQSKRYYVTDIDRRPIENGNAYSIDDFNHTIEYLLNRGAIPTTDPALAEREQEEARQWKALRESACLEELKQDMFTNALIGSQKEMFALIEQLTKLKTIDELTQAIASARKIVSGIKECTERELERRMPRA